MQEKRPKKINNQKEQLIKKVEKREKSESLVMLRNNSYDILVAYDVNTTAKGEDVLKKFANNDRMINCKNFF